MAPGFESDCVSNMTGVKNGLIVKKRLSMNNWDSLHVGHRFELAFPVLEISEFGNVNEFGNRYRIR